MEENALVVGPRTTPSETLVALSATVVISATNVALTGNVWYGGSGTV